MLKINASGLFNKIKGYVNPQSVLDGLNDVQRDMCNIYAAAARESAVSLPTVSHIRDTLNANIEFEDLRSKYNPSDIKTFVETFDRPVLNHLIIQGGVKPQEDNEDHSYPVQGALKERTHLMSLPKSAVGFVHEADGVERIQLQTYADAVRFHGGEKMVLDVAEIEEFISETPNVRNYCYGYGIDINDFAKNTRHLVLNTYASIPAHRQEKINQLLDELPAFDDYVEPEEDTPETT